MLNRETDEKYMTNTCQSRNGAAESVVAILCLRCVGHVLLFGAGKVPFRDAVFRASDATTRLSPPIRPQKEDLPFAGARQVVQRRFRRLIGTSR